MTNLIPSNNKGRRNHDLAEDVYAGMLLRMIESVGNDRLLLRNLIYTLALDKLKREAFLGPSRLEYGEALRHLAALESAIARVEVVSTETDRHDLSPPLLQYGHLVHLRSDSIENANVLAPSDLTQSKYYDSATDVARKLPAVVVGPSRRQVAARIGMVGLAVFASTALGLFSYSHVRQRESRQAVIVESQMAKIKRMPQLVEQQPLSDESATQKRAPLLPLPTTFGIYALANGRLHQLQPLPARVPDERVAIGPILSVPVQTLLPNGKLAFIVFRRDLVANTPERVSVRVVAKITRTLSFESGKAISKVVEGSWAVRGGKSLALRAAPLGDDQQMILLRPESDEFQFSPGRYALVLKNQAYDFSVDGPVTDPAQCVESVQTVNGTVYSACQGL